MTRALAFLALTAGCLANEDPAQQEAICGDGVCNGVETHTTCPFDCDQGCDMTFPESCAGDTICLDSICVAAFGRLYRFRVVDFSAAELDPQGAQWDDFLDGPDPFVEVALDTEVILTTEVVDDVFDVLAFTENADTTVVAGTNIGATAFDFDDEGDTTILACNTPLTAQILRAGGLDCVGSKETFGSAFTVEITPR